VQVSIGVIVLHIADDNFIQPNPGTGAADHLISGLVPIAILVAAAAAYRRLRAGARAATALLVGFFGVLTGSEAIYYTMAVGPSGDDYTGLMSTLAGLILLTLGAVVLWTSRRRADALVWRYTRRVLMTAGVAFIVMAVLFPIALSYVVTHTLRADVPTADLGTAHQDVEFVTGDGLTLRGWYIPSKNGAAVISFPGRSGSRTPARFLARHGFGVLLFDRRGEGDSEGDPNALGWNGGKDIEGAIAFLKKRPDVDPERIGGIGLSVGGEMMIEEAARNDALKAIVSEGAGIRSVREANEVSGGVDKWLQVIAMTSMTAGTAIFSNNSPPENLKDLARRISPRPVFFIYAARGQGGEDLSADFYEAAGQPKQLWKTDSDHVGGYEAAPAEYERRVVRFFKNALSV
jgi:fermentation-respiration switch protein FrsA (DUF1100 family)